MPSFEAKEKVNFRIVQLKSTVVKSKYGSHEQHFTSCKSHTPLLILPPPHATKLYNYYRISLCAYSFNQVLAKGYLHATCTKCLLDFHLFAKAIHTKTTG
jgi:hypothetical protein